MPVKPYTIALRGMYYGRLGPDAEDRVLARALSRLSGARPRVRPVLVRVERVRRRHGRIVPGVRSSDWQPGGRRQRRAAVPDLGRLRRRPVLRTAPDRGRVLHRRRRRVGPEPARRHTAGRQQARRQRRRRRSASTCSTSPSPRSTSSVRSIDRRAGGCGSSSSGLGSRSWLKAQGSGSGKSTSTDSKILPSLERA